VVVVSVEVGVEIVEEIEAAEAFVGVVAARALSLVEMAEVSVEEDQA